MPVQAARTGRQLRSGGLPVHRHGIEGHKKVEAEKAIEKMQPTHPHYPTLPTPYLPSRVRSSTTPMAHTRMPVVAVICAYERVEWMRCTR